MFRVFSCHRLMLRVTRGFRVFSTLLNSRPVPGRFKRRLGRCRSFTSPARILDRPRHFHSPGRRHYIGFPGSGSLFRSLFRSLSVSPLLFPSPVSLSHFDFSAPLFRAARYSRRCRGFSRPRGPLKPHSPNPPPPGLRSPLPGLDLRHLRRSPPSSSLSSTSVLIRPHYGPYCPPPRSLLPLATVNGPSPRYRHGRPGPSHPCFFSFTLGRYTLTPTFTRNYPADPPSSETNALI